jgi:hypothetical protein
MPLMTIFEPLLLLSVVTALVVLMVTVVAALRGRRAQALRRLKWLGVASTVYMSVVLAVSAAMPRKVYRIGDTQCFDDWCIAVTSATRAPRDSVAVNIRLSSRAKRVPQAEKGTVVYLVDAAGGRYDAVPDPLSVPLDTRLQPGASVNATRRFAVRPDAGALDLVYTHEGGFPIGFFIIGENEWFHGPPIVQLERQTGSVLHNE